MGVKQNFFSRADEPGKVVQAGYCAHNTETFPTWHRPYLAMLEVRIRESVYALANYVSKPSSLKW